MKVLVAVKRVVDDNVRVRLKGDGSGVETAHAKKAMNPFDEPAVEAAVRLREAGVAEEVVAVSVGEPGCEEVLRTALAFGADRAQLIEAEGELEPLGVSKALAAVAEREAPGLILLGQQATDDDAAQTGPMLAARLGWGQATFACALEAGEGEVRVTREVDGGKRDVAVPLPAVVTADLALNEPRYVKLPSIMKAKKKPLERQALEALGVDAAPRLDLLEVSEPPARPPGVRVDSAEALAERLRNEAQVC
ncbi:electron transfer flavoprotein subunit beta/FixA family protein [Halorhodospira neutriphila]|uniref:Electron transfer flavoprotein subunit beta n=1 Tax=Halorhodospira neutriphila TaxID=168379 RepID=A0ABS1E4Y9_9GAMM|nr:electron transfer flavoprotein subunit beta/FixA family protein [Halorhodospira neutriphila]MBK1726811.1 electron transfer flavoprotein subunit beta [Halorhodospira neutriphila]